MIRIDSHTAHIKIKFILYLCNSRGFQTYQNTLNDCQKFCNGVIAVLTIDWLRKTSLMQVVYPKLSNSLYMVMLIAIFLNYRIEIKFAYLFWEPFLLNDPELVKVKLNFSMHISAGKVIYRLPKLNLSARVNFSKKMAKIFKRRFIKG